MTNNPTSGDPQSDDVADGWSPRHRLFTIAPGSPFLDRLARAVLDGRLPGASPNGSSASPPDPLARARLTIFLPTRRACRALQEAFLRASNRRALLLPALRPVGDPDEDADLIQSIGSDSHIPSDDLNAPIDQLSRELLLANLILNWYRTAPAAPAPNQQAPNQQAHDTHAVRSPAQAVRLARALARFIDEIETETVALDKLASLVPDDLSGHWQTTLSFLSILTDKLPAELKARNLASPVELRNRKLLAEAARIRSGGYADGVIVAGVTGSVPATVDLIDAAARHPNGAVVLPGLDTNLDNETFDAILGGDTRLHATSQPDPISQNTSHPEHPQFALAKLLKRLGASRDSVLALGDDSPNANVATPRSRIVSEVMRPAATTDAWSTIKQRIDPDAVDAAFERVSLLTLPSSLDEAEAIALILRQTIETPGKTAALVSPDRLLARRVITRLASWGVEVDDSAGRPFRKTECGTLITLILEAVSSRFAPLPVTLLLKHPLVRLGLELGDVRRRARNLEIGVFRTVYSATGLDGLATAIARAQSDVESGRRLGRTVKVLSSQNWDDAADLVARLHSAVLELDTLYRSDRTHRMSDLVRALVAAVDAVAAGPVDTSDDGTALDADDTASDGAAWSAEGGPVGAEVFARLLEQTTDELHIRAADFADVLGSLTASETVRPGTRVHPRIAIWGPLEARLQQPDVIVLGALNEGIWPQLPDTGPWINRPMRRALGLPQPEEALGRAAHDVTQLLGAETVYLTRAQKVDGKPTVPSRWLLRLNAVLAAFGKPDVLRSDHPWTAWASARTLIRDRITIAPPAPKPPTALRPRRLSVTDVERWIANPYAIYARKILLLEPLPTIGGNPDAAMRGAIVHEALSTFAGRYPRDLPSDPAQELVAIAEDLMADLSDHASVLAFWRPRFERFAKWFAETEPARRAGLTKVHSEVDARLKLDCAIAVFTLTARADRIDDTDAGLMIYDYKGAQGIEALAGKVDKGIAPQLLLEAALAQSGAFADVATETVSGLAYISTSGGYPPGKQLDLDVGDVRQAAAEALRHVADLADRFADPDTPYAAVRRAAFDYRFDDYAHLARITEWSGRDAADGGSES
ncbi:MAG: double-strand break repair protein AddB [Pseudomonadota bacterium]